MATSYKGVKVPLFCERCGKGEFEGVVFGRKVIRHLRIDSPRTGMICDHCLEPPRLAAAGPAPMWSVPAAKP